MLFVLILVGLSIFLLPRLITGLYAWPRTVRAENAPTKPAAIVFGAGLWRDGSPSPVLRDRVATAAQLYFAGKVKKLLMSGDNSYIYYNEPGAMHEYAIGLGVPEEDIVLDYAGRRTYDTCYRAKEIFGLKEAILVTQPFHLPRALYTCNQLGLKAVGVPADQLDYRIRAQAYWHAREILATLVALWEVHFSHPLPVLGQPEPIFPVEAQ
jgi:vancomycin permeability regulator SanA